MSNIHYRSRSVRQPWIKHTLQVKVTRAALHQTYTTGQGQSGNPASNIHYRSRSPGQPCITTCHGQPVSNIHSRSTSVRHPCINHTLQVKVSQATLHQTVTFTIEWIALFKTVLGHAVRSGEYVNWFLTGHTVLSHFNRCILWTHLNEGLYFHPDEGRVVVRLGLLVDSGPQFVCEHLIRHLTTRVLPLHLPVLGRHLLRVFCTKATKVALVSRHQGSSHQGTSLQNDYFTKSEDDSYLVERGHRRPPCWGWGRGVPHPHPTPAHCASLTRPPSAQKTVNVQIKSNCNETDTYWCKFHISD